MGIGSNRSKIIRLYNRAEELESDVFGLYKNIISNQNKNFFKGKYPRIPIYESNSLFLDFSIRELAFCYSEIMIAELEFKIGHNLSTERLDDNKNFFYSKCLFEIFKHRVSILIFLKNNNMFTEKYEILADMEYASLIDEYGDFDITDFNDIGDLMENVDLIIPLNRIIEQCPQLQLR